MNVSCAIIRDLLPLYAEDVVSPETRALVEDHVCTCEACQGELAALKAPTEEAPGAPMETPEALLRIRKMIRRRRIWILIAAVLVAASVFLGIAVYLNGSIWLTAEQVGATAVEQGDGSIQIRYSTNCTENRLSTFSENGDCGFLFATSRRAYYANRSMDVSWGTTGFYLGELLEPATELNYWSVNPQTGELETLLWDGGQPYPEHQTVPDFTLFYRYLFWVTAVLAMLVTVVAWYGRRKSWGGGICIGGMALWSICLSTFANSDAGMIGFQGVTMAEILRIAAMGALFLVTALCVRKVCKFAGAE